MTTVEGDNTKLKADNTKWMEDNADLSARLVPLELASKICVADSVRNIAAQVVLFWAAVEPRKFPAGSRPVLHEANLRRSTAGEDRFGRLVAQILQTKKLDDVVLRHNGQLHISDWVALGRRVANMLAYFERCPSPQDKRIFKDEIYVLKTFLRCGAQVNELEGSLPLEKFQIKIRER